MSNIPADLKYTEEHEWVKDLGNGQALIGITDYAQQSLGDVTFVELPPVDESFERGDTFGVVESVKAASDLYMPVAGTVIEVNSDLEAAPEQVNESPYEGAWLIKVALEEPAQMDDLLDAEAYAKIAE